MDVKHRAQDKNGNIFDFEEKPVIRKRDCVWDLSGIRYEFVEYGKPNPDWETACFDLSEGEPVIIDGILCAPMKKQKHTTNCTSIEFEEHLRKTSNLDIKESPEFEDHSKKSGCLGEERKPTIADKAKEIIHGDRESTYGDPSKNLKCIASLWSTYTGIDINANDVCNMMVLLKVARLKNSPAHEDSMIDIIGYTLLQETIK